jgi:hypothetical protein
MLATDEQLIAVQIPTIVIVETEAVVTGHRHFPFRRGEKKQISMLDDDGLRNAVSHSRFLSVR